MGQAKIRKQNGTYFSADGQNTTIIINNQGRAVAELMNELRNREQNEIFPYPFVLKITCMKSDSEIKTMGEKLGINNFSGNVVYVDYKFKDDLFDFFNKREYGKFMFTMFCLKWVDLQREGKVTTFDVFFTDKRGNPYGSQFIHIPFPEWEDYIGKYNEIKEYLVEMSEQRTMS